MNIYVLFNVDGQIEVFTNSLQHKNANIANFISAVLLEIRKTNDVSNLEIKSTCTHSFLISHLLTTFGTKGCAKLQ